MTRSKWPKATPKAEKVTPPTLVLAQDELILSQEELILAQDSSSSLRIAHPGSGQLILAQDKHDLLDLQNDPWSSKLTSWTSKLDLQNYLLELKITPNPSKIRVGGMSRKALKSAAVETLHLRACGEDVGIYAWILS